MVGFGYAFGPMIMGRIIDAYSIFLGCIIVSISGVLGMSVMLLIEKYMNSKSYLNKGE